MASYSVTKCTAAFIDAFINDPQIVALMLIRSILSSCGRPSLRRTYEQAFSRYLTLLGDMSKLRGNNLAPTGLFVDHARGILVLEFGFASACHTREPGALSFFESMATGFTVPNESKVVQFAVRFPGFEMSSNYALLETD